MSARAAHRVFLGLGSNIGDRRAILDLAIERLEEFLTIVQVSPLYDTAPQDVTAQPDFLNLALEARTDLAPRVLLDGIKAIERALGRPAVDPVRQGPRTIDIDLLFYDDLVLRETDRPGLRGLCVPHPRAHERSFVLVPLADIAPALVHPTLGVTIAVLRERVGDDGVRPASTVAGLPAPDRAPDGRDDGQEREDEGQDRRLIGRIPAVGP